MLLRGGALILTCAFCAQAAQNSIGSAKCSVPTRRVVLSSFFFLLSSFFFLLSSFFFLLSSFFFLLSSFLFPNPDP
jgi:hypothetical protein